MHHPAPDVVMRPAVFHENAAEDLQKEIHTETAEEQRNQHAFQPRPPEYGFGFACQRHLRQEAGNKEKRLHAEQVLGVNRGIKCHRAVIRARVNKSSERREDGSSVPKDANEHQRGAQLIKAVIIAGRRGGARGTGRQNQRLTKWKGPLFTHGREMKTYCFKTRQGAPQLTPGL